MQGDIMKVRDILSNRQSGKSITRRTVSDVRRDRSDDSELVFVNIEDRSATDPVYRDPVNQVGVPIPLPSADVSRKEAERMGFQGREAKPSHLNSDFQKSVAWEELYRQLWKIKDARLKKHHR